MKLRRLATRLFSLQPDPRACVEGEAIRLFWWNKVANLGDAFSPMVVAYLSNRPVVHAGKRDHCKLVACGSVLSKARSGDIVWGSGSLDPDPKMRSANIDVRAVRGPLTRRILLRHGVECPEVYGDPGCLIRQIFPRPEGFAPRFKVGLIPHYKEKGLVGSADPSVRILDIQTPPEVFLPALWECERVLSSSLHGIIFAESYGIPAAWVELTGSVVGGGHKFFDYYQGTGRDAPNPLRNFNTRTEAGWIPPALDNAGMLRASFPFSAK